MRSHYERRPEARIGLGKMSKSLTNSAPKVAGNRTISPPVREVWASKYPVTWGLSPQSNPGPALTKAGAIKRRNLEFHNRDSMFSPSTAVDKSLQTS
jgi:hypothetical protein